MGKPPKSKVEVSQEEPELPEEVYASAEDFGFQMTMPEDVPPPLSPSQLGRLRKAKTRKTPLPPPERHRWLDQWLTAGGEPLKQVVRHCLRNIDHHEAATRVRTRARKPEDRQKFEKMVEVLVANLAYAVVNPPPTGRITVDVRNGDKGRSRYDNPAVSPRMLRDLFTTMHDTGFLEFRTPKTTRGEKSSVAPVGWLVESVLRSVITLADFHRDTRQETVVLTRKTKGSYNYFSGEASYVRKERVEYRDTPETIRMREQMRRVNDWLAAADLSYVGTDELVDVQDRVMRRMFVIQGKQGERFDQSGRLFGGFWQPMRKERRKNIRIDGEPVSNLDFSTMFTRLAYAEVGAEPPPGDLYAIPGLEGYRSGVKLAMNTFMFAKGKKQRWPEGMGVGVGDDEAAKAGEVPAADYDARLPAGWTVSRMRKAVLDRHPALAPVLEKGMGYRFMFTESEVLLGVLERLMGLGITALPLHDGLLTARSKARVVEMVMKEVGQMVTAVTLPITSEDL